MALPWGSRGERDVHLEGREPALAQLKDLGPRRLRVSPLEPVCRARFFSERSKARALRDLRAIAQARAALVADAHSRSRLTLSEEEDLARNHRSIQAPRRRRSRGHALGCIIPWEDLE